MGREKGVRRIALQLLVTATPEVVVTHLTDERSLVLACDGVFDVVSAPR